MKSGTWARTCQFRREKDIDEVLQATTVFSNVSKGTLAKHEDLVDVFGTDDEEKVCRIILAEGDLQASCRVLAVVGLQHMGFNRIAALTSSAPHHILAELLRCPVQLCTMVLLVAYSEAV